MPCGGAFIAWGLICEVLTCTHNQSVIKDLVGSHRKLVCFWCLEDERAAILFSEVELTMS